MSDPRIDLKNRYFAAGLAYLVPGAGHCYQGRLFKGALYFVCIVGTYLFGLSLSEWKAVYWQWEPGRKNIAFFAQAGVGLVAIPAYIQAKRYAHPDNHETVDQPLAAEFRGELWNPELIGTVQGHVESKAVAGAFGDTIRGTFSGELLTEDGRSQPLELTLGGPLETGVPIAAGEERYLRTNVIEVREDGSDVDVGRIDGFIPRNFINHFAAPLQDKDKEELNGRLGKYFELAKIFTWIAGLLNVLAVWDALEGPAYGYGDEEEDESSDENKEKSNKEAAAGETTIVTQSKEPPQPTEKVTQA